MPRLKLSDSHDLGLVFLGEVGATVGFICFEESIHIFSSFLFFWIFFFLDSQRIHWLSG
jgi:hypothetical protein